MVKTDKHGMVKRPINWGKVFWWVCVYIVLFVICLRIYIIIHTDNQKSVIRINPPKAITSVLKQTKVNLTVYIPQKKCCGRQFPKTICGQNILTCADSFKCCAVSKEMLQRLGLNFGDSILVQSLYPILNNYYRIVDCNQGYNIVELVIKKTPQVSLKFYLKNQQIFINN